MPLTQLDPKAAVIAIDLQKGIVAMPTVHPGMEIVDRSAQLARAFRKKGLPVVLVNVAGRAPGRTDSPFPKFAFPPDWIDLVPELDPQPTDHLVTKHCVGAFLGTDLDAYLRKNGVTQVFFTGIAASGGVESTARNAYDLGYNVVFVADAMTDRDADTHRHCTEKFFPRIGEVDSTANILKALEQ